MIGLPRIDPWRVDPGSRTILDEKHPFSRLTDNGPPRLTGEMAAAQAIVLERAQQGDTEAFRRLVEENSNAMFRLAYRMTGLGE